jgi:hypothetical protein
MIAIFAYPVTNAGKLSVPWDLQGYGSCLPPGVRRRPLGGAVITKVFRLIKRKTFVIMGYAAVATGHSGHTRRAKGREPRSEPINSPALTR